MSEKIYAHTRSKFDCVIFGSVQLTATAVSGNTRVQLHVPCCSADVVQRLLCINILVLHVDPLECPRINPVHQLKRKSGRTLSELTIASIASEPD